jgi:hypothetical protein
VPHRPFAFCLPLLLCSLIVVAPAWPARAENYPVTLTLPGTDSLSMKITAAGFGSDTKSSTVSGSLDTTLDLLIDPATWLATTNVLTINSGTVSMNNNLTFSLAFGVEKVHVDNMSGTISGSGPVTNNAFVGSDHVLTLNQGKIYDSLQYVNMNLADSPMSATLQDGTITVSEAGKNGNVVTYDVALTAPVNFTSQVSTAPAATVTITGTLHAFGQLAVAVPEPGTLSLLIGGVLSSCGASIARRRRRSNAMSKGQAFA